MTRHTTQVLSALLLGLLLAAAPALASKTDDTLRWASDREVENADAYYNSAREGILIARLTWDQLLYRDPVTGEYKGLLAKQVRWVNDTTIDADLREGITFHNGEKFDADDVVFTFNYVINPENKVVTKTNVDYIQSAEKLGPYKVRIHLKAPFPAAFEYLAGPNPIYPNEYYAKVGPKGMGLNPVGTGPYKVVEVQPGKLVRWVKNEGYFKDSPKGQPSIRTVEFRTIPDRETQIAELMTGGLDWVWRVPPEQAERLSRVPTVTVMEGETMRVGYVGMRTRTERNIPLKDVRVRKAIAHAIDRAAIAKNLMGGSSRVIHTACFPEQFGCTDEGAPRYDFDPARSRQLLKEAGFPNGLSIDLYAYRERPVAEAMIGYLRDVGITANLRYLKYSALRDQVRSGDADLYFMTWGSFSVADTSAITGNFFKFQDDDAHFDAQVRDWLAVADTSIDPAVRKSNYKMALTRIQEQAYWLPLFTYSIFYAVNKDLSFTPTTDEIPRFVQSRWK
jgi:peptide/nickel transport system substrate-binding protein